MWTNHHEEYVHKKFKFIHTMTMENDWLIFKRDFGGVHKTLNHKQIQDYCNVYTVFKSLVAKKHRYAFWLRMIKYFYYD